MFGFDAIPSDTGSTVIQVAGVIASLGFAVWYAWYATTNTIPKLQDNHTTLVKEIVAKHAETIDKTVKEFRDEAREQRDMHERRSQVCNELARQGQIAVTSLAQSVSEMSKTVDRELIKNKQ